MTTFAAALVAATAGSAAAEAPFEGTRQQLFEAIVKYPDDVAA
ncbi:hypothetical protein MES5069_260040 [Mesorhizobium escarrei]|uniref:Uncharacterized protein n=1 Tax=Mesorhizobium escarrei TaxID=666018 RepID=A0ABN8JTM3_9HYPH|nr:hypothetical protein MES5069_260040 [Mesorhizobium escarrei]